MKYVMKYVLPSLIVTILAFGWTSCIRFSSPKQTTIKATSTVRLENKSSDWLFARGDLGMGVSTESGLPEKLNGTKIWTYDIRGGWDSCGRRG